MILGIVLVGFCFFSIVSSASKLDCDFSGECCWATAREQDQWEIRSGDELDMNDFRRVFLAGKSRPPPAANYAIRVENQRRSSLISCAVCTATGHVTIKFRHWQSANAILRICWQAEGDGSPEPENCLVARHAKQSKLNVYRFKKLAKSQNFRLVFIVENADEKLENHEATVIIDKITVDYDSCDSDDGVGRVTTTTTKKPKHTINSINRHKTRSITPIKSQNKNKEEDLNKIDKQIAQVVDELNAKQITTTTTPKGPVDPLTDLLGSKFVEFLDPNYESEDEPEDDSDQVDAPITSTIATTTRTLPIKRVETSAKLVDIQGLVPTTRPVVVATTPIAIRQILAESVLKYLPRGKPLQVQPQNGVFAIQVHQPHTIPVGPPSTCSTQGGCLFESTFCTWKTPVGVQNKFHIKKVHMSSFAEAIVPSGELSIMETDTKMLKPHTVLFDALEFSLGNRLIACCLADGKLTCPFATPTEQTAVIWQFSKFECPAGTSKIAFICENFGTSDGICAVDNVRIHTSTDVFFLEPCQKEKL